MGVSWERPDSGFTLLFEAMIMPMVTAMPVKAVARLVGEQDTRLWRLLNHYVDKARDQLDLSQVKRVGIDETSGKKGHNYVSVFVDLDTPKVICATEGKGADTVKRFSEDFAEHDGKPDAVEESCCDMSPAFVSGIGQYLPKSQITFDKFHVMKIINNAVDEVRRQEQKNHPELKKTRYIWLKNPDKLKKDQSKQFEELKIPKLNLKTARAYHIKLNFQEFWTQTPENAEAFLKKWYFWATHSKLEPVKQAAYTVKRHWDGILRWFHSHINNGILEGINSLIQAAKAKARGHRSSRNYITMIYLIAGKLDYTLPT
ncbi:ISL3-like element ISMac21 family transposase [Desulfocicer niacini]